MQVHINTSCITTCTFGESSHACNLIKRLRVCEWYISNTAQNLFCVLSSFVYYNLLSFCNLFTLTSLVTMTIHSWIKNDLCCIILCCSTEHYIILGFHFCRSSYIQVKHLRIQSEVGGNTIHLSFEGIFFCLKTFLRHILDHYHSLLPK